MSHTLKKKERKGGERESNNSLSVTMISFSKSLELQYLNKILTFKLCQSNYIKVNSETIIFLIFYKVRNYFKKYSPGLSLLRRAGFAYFYFA